MSVISCKIEEPQNPPTVITRVASDVGLKNATLNGEVTDEGFSAASERGFVYSEKNTNPSVSDSKVQSGYGKGIYSFILEKLTVNTKYYFKAYATNTKGTSYGDLQSFTTSDYSLASLNTDSPKNLTYLSVLVTGKLINDGGLKISDIGFCLSLNPSPTVADTKINSLDLNNGLFSSQIINLKESTKYYVRSFATNGKGTSYGNEISFVTLSKNSTRDVNTQIIEVVSKTGRIWMDRNLGASQVATSPKDEKSYGDYYQWGRGFDGHQIYNSPTTSTLSLTDIPENGNFIFVIGGTDWRKTPNDNLWQGTDGVNNPCPKGFRVPTQSEWFDEINTWISKDANGAFASPLKLPLAGYRFPSNAAMGYTGASGYYNSSTPTTTSPSSQSPAYRALRFTSGLAEFNNNYRADGSSVRCIKD